MSLRRILLSVGFFSLLFLSFVAGQFAAARHPPRLTAAELRQQFDFSGIPALLNRQARDWNRGDLDAFAAGYKNSPDILFIGRKVSRGFDQMLASYRKGYPSKDAMGTLTFSQLEVQPLDPRFATATGHYHLERAASGGGNADGYFLLVLENTASGWKVVRDDTTSLPQGSPGNIPAGA